MLEFVKGDLKQIIEDRSYLLDAGDRKCILLQAMKGLEYLHNNWILHRVGGALLWAHCESALCLRACRAWPFLLSCALPTGTLTIVAVEPEAISTSRTSPNKSVPLLTESWMRFSHVHTQPSQVTRFCSLGIFPPSETFPPIQDIKPDNLLMNSRGVIKLADFGLARQFGSPDRNCTPRVVTLYVISAETVLAL